VRTYYYGYMNVTLTVDEEVMRKARKQAEAMGTSVNQLIRDYLASFTSHHSNGAQLAQEYMELLRTSQGNSRGWKFNREELHERR